MTGPATDDRVLVRRLDWRFLLPDPRLGRVAYFGPPDGELRRALRRFAAAVVEVDGEDRGGGAAKPGTFEVVVVAPGRSDDLPGACALLAPGGHLYWEIDRRHTAGGSAGFLTDPRDVAGSLGLHDVRVHWHHPDLERARLLLPPDRAAVRYALERRSRRPPFLDRLLAAGVTRLAIPRLVPTLSLVARKPGGPGACSVPAPVRLAADGSATGAAGDPPYAILTPRFRASRHVVTAVLEPGTAAPVAVAKTARLPGPPGSLGREALALRAAADALPDPASVPRMRALAAPGGHPTLVESAVAGRLLTPADVRSDPERWTRRVCDWITALHGGTREPCDGTSLRRRWIEEPLDRIERDGVLTGEDVALPDRTRRLTRRLSDVVVPAVLEHGDVSCPNLLATGTGRIGLVDWERADRAGPPGADLFFFLAFAGVSREGDAGADGALGAFRRTFRGADAWARPHIWRYWRALDLPAAALAPLFVACWARRAAVASGQRDRHVRFWSEACAWAEEEAMSFDDPRTSMPARR